jgi:hypothetical protein
MTRRLVLLAISLALALVSVEAVANGATDRPLTISPSQGTVLAAGVTVHVTGTGCPDPSWDDTLEWHVHVRTLQGGSAPTPLLVTPPSGTPTNPLAFPAIGFAGAASADTTPAADGSWAVDLVIPGSDSGSLAANPGETYPITATCYAAEGIEAGTIRYASEEFLAFAKGGPPPITNTTPIQVAPTFTG